MYTYGSIILAVGVILIAVLWIVLTQASKYRLNKILSVGALGTIWIILTGLLAHYMLKPKSNPGGQYSTVSTSDTPATVSTSDTPANVYTSDTPATSEETVDPNDPNAPPASSGFYYPGVHPYLEPPTIEAVGSGLPPPLPAS